MTTELSLFNNKATADLSYLQTAGPDTLTRQLAGSLSGKRISIKGGVFRMIDSGQEVAKSSDRHLMVVIVDAAPTISRTYYKEQYQEGVVAVPTCWSDDGVIPDAACPTKMSVTCANCPMNIKGSGQGDSRACRYSQRLVVVLANDIYGDVFGMTLAATSLFGKGDDHKMPLQQYTRKLGTHGLPVRAVVTKMMFDLDVSTPKLVFSAERPLTETEFKAVVATSQTDECKDAIAAPNYAQFTAAKPTPLFNQPVPVPEPKASDFVPVTPAPEPEEVAKPTVKKKAAAAAAPADLASVLADWDQDDD